MRASLTLGRLPSHRPIGTLLLTWLAACAGDGILLPERPDEAPIPSQLRVVSGDGQTGVAGDPVRHPLVVEVLDGAGQAFPGALVVFEFVDPPNGAEIAPPNVETDDSGRASVAVKLGNVAGDQPVEARLEDPASDLRAHFLLTAIQRPPTGGGGGGGEGDGDDGGGGGGGGGGAGGGGGSGDGDDDGGNGNGNGKDKGKDKGNGNGDGGGGGGDDDGDEGGDD